MGVGGSIPFVSAFSEQMAGAPVILIGAGDPTSSVHAPNESQDLDDLEKSVLVPGDRASPSSRLTPLFDLVLYRPEIAPNTGACMRLAANTGCSLAFDRTARLRPRRRQAAQGGNGLSRSGHRARAPRPRLLSRAWCDRRGSLPFPTGARSGTPRSNTKRAMLFSSDRSRLGSLRS